jgi:hypothetical protein
MIAGIFNSMLDNEGCAMCILCLYRRLDSFVVGVKLKSISTEVVRLLSARG